MKEPKIEEINNPSEKIIKIAAKSILISRLPGDSEDDFKTALIKVFDSYNPHKQNVFPTHEYKFNNIEKVRLIGLNCAYYTEGSDIVINDLEKLEILHEDVKLEIKGTQISSLK